MARSDTKIKQRKMFDDRDRKEALKKGVTVKKLREDRLEDNRNKAITAASLLPVGGLAIKGLQGGSKLFSAAKKLFKSSKPAKTSNTTKLSKTTKTKPTNTTKTTKSNKKTKVTPTTVTKPKQGPFPKVYKRPIGPKPKTSTRIKNFVRKNKVPIVAGAAALGTGTALLSGGKSNKNNKKVKKDPVITKPNKSPIKKVKTEKLKKMGPTKDYVGQFVNKKGDVAYDSVGDFLGYLTGKQKKRARPKNRQRIQAETKGATKGIGFTGKSGGNPFKFNRGGKMVKRAAGGLKPVPEGNKGLGKLPQPVRNKMGYMKKGGVVKMRGGGAATRGMNFNRGY
jgi:hypothetical protein